MKPITATLLAAAVIFSAGCSTYNREPDFQENLSSKLPLYQDTGWLPHRERYTQRFAWKMQLLADKLRQDLKDWDPNQTTVLMTTIVPVDDLNKATSFGRLCSEQLITELKKQGFRIIEARKTSSYLMRDKEGEFSLSRDPKWLGGEFKADAVLVGAYSKSGDQVIINVRMVSAADSSVLAAASAMMNLKGDHFLADMFREKEKSPGSLPDGRGIRVRKRVFPGIDSYAEVLESMVGDMAGEIASTALDKTAHASTIAVTTFVDVDNFYRATTFGRYLTEQLMAEFKSMGFNVLEIRLAPDLFTDIRIGELALTREMSQIMTNRKADALVVGVYTRAGDKITVNSRLVIGETQEIVGVGRMIVDAGSGNKFVTAMLENEVTTVMPTETVEGF